MLKVTVSIVPDGVGAEREIGVLHISNESGNALANYKCLLTADDLPRPELILLNRYPRWSASVWDLVARAIAKALSGQERLPRRPAQVTLPIYTAHMGRQYVRMEDIPEPARTAFDLRMRGSTAPVIPGETDCVYADDWLRFIELR